MIALIALFTAYAQDTIAALPCGQPSEAQTVIHYDPSKVGPVDRFFGISYRQALRLADQQAENNIGCTDAIARAVPSIEATRAGAKAVEQGRMASFHTNTADVATDTAALGYGRGYGSALGGLDVDLALASQHGGLGEIGGGKRTSTTAGKDADDKAEAARKKVEADAEKARKAREEEQELLITGGS